MVKLSVNTLGISKTSHHYDKSNSLRDIKPVRKCFDGGNNWFIPWDVITS